MKSYILAHDLGTSGNKATLFDENGKLVTSSVYSYSTHYFDTVCAEQDPQDWWQALSLSTKQLTQQINPQQIAAVSISGQMQGCLCVDKKGEALHHSMIYCDQRSSKQTEDLINAMGAKTLYDITGHRPSPTYSIEKLMWIKENAPEIYKRTHVMLQAKDYMVYKLTGNFVTELNDASGTNAFSLKTLSWSDEILKAAGISKEIFPQVHDSIDVVGYVTKEAASLTGLVEGTPVVAGGGDGGCASIGAGSVFEGGTYSYIGSSGWTIATATEQIDDPEMRVFTWAHPIRGYYQICGTMQTAGNCVSWLIKHVFNEIEDSDEFYKKLDKEVTTVPAGSKGLLFLPYLMGERTPWWDIKARGIWIGLGHETDWRLMARSVLEGVAMNLAYTYDLMSDTVKVEKSRIIGGGARIKSLVQILSDVIQKPIDILAILEESTSLGAAMIGGVGVGLYNSFEKVLTFNPAVDSFEPTKSHKETYLKLKEVFHKAYLQNKEIYEALFEFKL